MLSLGLNTNGNGAFGRTEISVTSENVLPVPKIDLDL